MDSETSASSENMPHITSLSHSRHDIDSIEQITPIQFNNVFILVRALSTFKFFYDKACVLRLIMMPGGSRSDPSARLMGIMGSNINDQHCPWPSTEPI